MCSRLGICETHVCLMCMAVFNSSSLPYTILEYPLSVHGYKHSQLRKLLPPGPGTYKEKRRFGDCMHAFLLGVCLGVTLLGMGLLDEV